jgi:site-specific DNA-methyltransferase (adenine-specific)
MEEHKFIYVDPNILVENEDTNQLYTSEPENLGQIKESIKQVGILEPLIVDPDNVIISGNIRRRIAIELKMTTVPVIYQKKSEINTKLLSVSHSQQRIKTPSEILKEIKILEENYPVGKGSRTDLNPEMKKNQEMRKNVNISNTKVNKLKNIEKFGKELYGEGTEKYKKLWNDIDSSKISIHKKVNDLKKKVEAKENLSVVPDSHKIDTENIKIYNKSCADMSEINDKSIATIVCSPPYYQLKDYGTGSDQRGMETNVEEYINGLMHDFKDCKRVLKDDGSLWVNLGDVFINGTYNLTPQRFAIAMMNEGWLVNDDIIWAKNNANFTCYNRSVRVHENIFHFTKSKDFYYNNSWLEELNDVDNKLSIGTKASTINLKSWMDCRESLLKVNANNMDDLRKACKDEGLNLTHSAAFPIIIPLIPILLTSKVGDTILDIYNGTATSGQAAVENGRKYIGYEIKAEYIKFSEVRLRNHLNRDSSTEKLAA